MTSGLSGPQSYSSHVQDTNKTTGSSAPSSATSTTRANNADTMARAEGTQSYVPVDIDPVAALPKLFPTSFSDPRADLFNFDQTVEPEQLYNEKLKSQLETLEGKNSKLADRVYFVLTHPDAKLSGNFGDAAKLAAKYQNEALKYARTTSGDTSFTAPKPDTAAANRELAAERNAIFEKLVNEQKGLSADQKSQLIFAYLHPEVVSKEDLTLKMQKLLTDLTKKAEQKFDKLGLAPSKYDVPKDSSDFDAKASYEFSNAFDEAFQGFAKNTTPPMGPAEFNYLRFRLNNPDGPMPPVPAGRTAEDMEAMLQKTKTYAQELFTKETGYPAKFTPPINGDFYNSVLLGRFEDAFEQKLANQSPPLTDEQKAMLRTALGQQTENIPKEIKALFEMIKGSALAEVIAAYDLPPSWNPKTRNLNDPSVIKQRAQIQTQMDGVKAAEEMVATLQTVINQMPMGADRMAYAAYLQAVGEALNKFSESLMVIAASDSEVSKKMAISTNESEQNRIKSQQHDADEARKKAKSAAKMNALMSVFMAIFMGPIGIALAIQKQVTGTNFFEQLVKVVMDAVDKSGMPDFLKAVFKAYLNFYITCLSLVLGGPFMAIQTFTERLASSVSDFLRAFGVPKDAADMAGMIVATVTTILIEIAIMVATMGGSSMSLVGSFGQIAHTVMAFVKEAVKVITDVLKSVRAFIMEIGPMIVKASAKAKQMLAKLQKLTDELQTLMVQAQKAAKVAKSGATAEKIAEAERLAQQVADKMKEVQELTAQLARQLRLEAMSKPELLRAGDLAAKQARNMTDAVKDLDKIVAEVVKSANSGVKSAQVLERRIQTAIKVVSYTSTGMTVASTAVGVSRELLLAQVAMLKAELEADNIKIRAVIKAIRAVIDEIVSGIGTTMDSVKRVQETQANKFPTFTFPC